MSPGEGHEQRKFMQSWRRVHQGVGQNGQFGDGGVARRNDSLVTKVQDLDGAGGVLPIQGKVDVGETRLASEPKPDL
ncbi:MAG: hypothetical protein IJJ33_19190, partial [Victivallales bacterium]|nr:hypothetical protein [Victivallales bacterium]